MVSSNNKAPGQGHVTSTFMWYFLKKKHNKNITWQQGLLDFVYNCVYYNSLYISQYPKICTKVVP